MFSGCTVVGNHSAVAGAAPAPHRKEQYSAAYRPPMPSPSAPPTADRGKGKRPATESGASGGGGGSSKKSRSDSTGQALERLAALREQSKQSHTREADAAKAKGLEACLELVENVGHRTGGLVWYDTCRLFRDEFHCHCFVCLHNAATRLEYISTRGNGADSSSGGTH